MYVIIDRETLNARGIHTNAFAEGLREAGVVLVQYRDKVGGPQEVLRAAREIAAVFEGVGARLILNDRADLAALLGWGVHVGQGDLSVEDAREMVRSSWHRGMQGSLHSAVAKDATAPVEMTHPWVGVSTHTEEQVRVACEPTSQKRDVWHTGVADYVAVGPVFATSTKVDAEAVVGLEGVRRARALTSRFAERRPLVAIGGITLENCRSVVEAGADSVAVISGMFVAGRTVRAVAEDFLERMR